MEYFGYIVIWTVEAFLKHIVNDFVKVFGNIIADIMGTSIDVLKWPIITNGIAFVQAVAISFLIAKVANEAIQTYILYTNGDSDADPGGLLIRGGYAAVMIGVMPWLVWYVFLIGSTLARDVTNIEAGLEPSKYLNGFNINTISDLVVNTGITLILLFIVALIFLVCIYAQTFIRSAELGLLAVVGSIMALNLASTDRSIYTAWFRELIIICCSQALQIFMLLGGCYALAGVVDKGVLGGPLLLFTAWLWVTIHSPKYLKQWAYSSGLGGAAGGAAKQAGTMYLTKLILTKGA